MTHPLAKRRIRRRGALLIILASLVAASPVTGRHAMEARADDDGGRSGSGGSSGGSGRDDGDDGHDDDGGGDDGDDGGDDHDGESDGGSGSGGSSSGNSSDRGTNGGGTSASGRPSTQRDGALAARLKGRIAPISEVETIAGKVVPGEIIDVRLYRNKDLYVYRVKVIQQTGSIYDVRIDAVTRKVLSARER